MQLDTAIDLLSLVALALPAIAIYIDFAFDPEELVSDQPDAAYDDLIVEQGTYHMARISIALFTLAGLLLIVQIGGGILGTVGLNGVAITWAAQAVDAALDVGILGSLAGGFGFFVMCVGTEKAGRLTETGILWGAKEAINHPVGKVVTGEDSRLFEPRGLRTDPVLKYDGETITTVPNADVRVVDVGVPDDHDVSEKRYVTLKFDIE